MPYGMSDGWKPSLGAMTVDVDDRMRFFGCMADKNPSCLCSWLPGNGGVADQPFLHDCRKMDMENPVDDELRAVIRTFCEELVQAVNSYYAFGSIFSDDAT